VILATPNLPFDVPAASGGEKEIGRIISKRRVIAWLLRNHWLGISIETAAGYDKSSARGFDPHHLLILTLTHGGILTHSIQILRSTLTYQGPGPKGSAALGGCSRTVSDSSQVMVEEIFSVVVPVTGPSTPPLIPQAATATAKTARVQIRINEDLGGVGY
jgi:hypothetical protein